MQKQDANIITRRLTLLPLSLNVAIPIIPVISVTKKLQAMLRNAGRRMNLKQKQSCVVCVNTN